MNKIVAIILLVILAVFLFFILKTLIPAFFSYLKKMPIGIFALLLMLVLAIMAYLIWFLVTSDGNGGALGNADNPGNTQISQEAQNTEGVESTKVLDNYILLRQDQILINNELVDMERLEMFIDDHVLSNTAIVIVDDYSSSSLHHTITEMCDKKGVKYSNKDEKWLEQ